MVPNKDITGVLPEESEAKLEKVVAPQAAPRKYQLVYRNLLTFTYWHLSAVYGLYLVFTSAKWATIAFLFFMYMVSMIGVTAGAHRLWSHRSYKAKWPLEVLLLIMFSTSFQNTALTWARDHRFHHKYTDTDADPHNATRGFFFSHIGWVLVKKHPDVYAQDKFVRMDDLYNNPLLRLQKKYAIPFVGALCFIIPTLIPVYFWGEGFSEAWHINMLRFMLTLNVTFLVNSAAHMFGYKPYDKEISGVQNHTVSALVFGEGFHNYHHTFPYDYRTAELGNNWLNFSTKFIDFFAWIGWAYDLKTVSQEAIDKRRTKNGDGTDLWGYENNDVMTD